jgi:hypothetical protein
MQNINNINADNRSENYEYEDSYDESIQETSSAGHEQADGESYKEFNVVVRGDTIRGSVNRNFASNRQSRIDISV